MHWKSDCTGFFLIYFKWCYYLCVTPFRFEWDTSLKRFRLEKNRFQSLLCLTQYILLGIWYLKDLRKIPIDRLYKNPDVYFSLAFNLNAIYYHIGVLACYFWRRQERFLCIVNFDCGNYATACVKKKILAVFLCFVFAIMPLLYSFSGYQVIPSSSVWDASLLFRCLVVEGRFAFFLSNTWTKSCEKNIAPGFHEMSIIDGLVGVLAFLMEIARQIVGFYSDFFPLICCLSLWASISSLGELLLSNDNLPPLHNHHHHLCRFDLEGNMRTKESERFKGNDYSKRISLPYISPSPRVALSLLERGPVAVQGSKEGMEIACREVGYLLLERYEVCKTFSRMVNRALGQLLFAYVLSSIMYLSTCMDAVLVLQDWSGKLRVAFFVFIFILMFFSGSEIVNKVYNFRTWLSTPANNVFLEEKHLLVLIHEVTCKPIGVSGNGMFTITYSTFMTVITTTVTFFIIILQFQIPGRGRGAEDTEDIKVILKYLMYLNTTLEQSTL